jgi:ATP-dependent DNA helicase RecG
MGPHTGRAEGENVEFKTRWVEDAMKDLAAFANTSGGVLYLGVDDSGLVVPDADVSEAYQRKISSKIVNQFQVVPSILVEDRDGARFLAVSISPIGGRVLLLRGVAYRRSGSASVEVPAPELQSFILQQTGQTWDSLPAAATLDDIDPEKVLAFIRSAHSRDQQRLPDGIRETDPVELNLDKLELLKNSKPTNAAMLLFGREPQRLCRHARTRVFYFRDINDFDEYPACTGTVGE